MQRTSVTTAGIVLRELRSQAEAQDPKSVASLGLATGNRLGVPVPALRVIAKRIGPDHRLALALWGTGFAEARILASRIDEPALVDEAQADRWAGDFDAWDVCDQVCQNLFDHAPWAWRKIDAWAERDEEFVRRAAFVLVACRAKRDRAADDARFIGLFPLLLRGANDERNFVRKAVSWALRNIGKRNRRLNRAAIGFAADIRALDTPAAKWIASDALRELESAAVRQRLRA